MNVRHRDQVLTSVLAAGAIVAVFFLHGRDLRRVADWMLYLGLPASLAFTVLYGVRSRWRTTAEGRALFYRELSVTGIAILVALSLWLGPGWPGHEQARYFVYAYFLFSAWRLVLSLLRAQARSGDAVDRAEDSGPRSR